MQRGAALGASLEFWYVGANAQIFSAVVHRLCASVVEFFHHCGQHVLAE